MTATQLVTAEELLLMSSNAPYELWEGVLKKVSPSSFRPGEIGARILIFVGQFVIEHELGHLTNADGGYLLNTDPATVVAPDVGFVRGDCFPDGAPDRGFCPVPPDLAVEVISPTDKKSDIMRKQELYTKAGVPLVWWVDPERKMVTVYRLGQASEIVKADGMLDGGGFELKVQSIFRD